MKWRIAWLITAWGLICTTAIALAPPARAQNRIACASEAPLVRLQPQVRSQPLPPVQIRSLERKVIEPFLAAPRIFEADHYQYLPRIVASVGQRSLITQGDRIYARSVSGQAFVIQPNMPDGWNIYRDPTPLKDPVSGAVLGMEAQFVGRARLLQGERVEKIEKDKKMEEIIHPATLEVVHAISEIRPGDRLFSSVDIGWRDLSPHPAPAQLSARIISIYGDGVASAAQNQIVVLNQGRAQGLEPGHIMAVRKAARWTTDLTDPQRPILHTTPELAGQAMVFLTFEKLAYALIGETNQVVQVGDSLNGL
jgi:hypothetical protein